MNQKLKNVKHFLYICITVLLLNSCTEEKEFIENANTENQLILKTVNLKTLTNKPLDIVKFQRKIEARNKAKTENRLVYDSVNNFYIDEDFAKYIEYNGKISYTIPIKRHSSEKIENILLNEKESGSYDIYLVKYDFTPEELKQLSLAEINQKQPIYILSEFDENGLMSAKIANPMDNIICTTSYTWQYASEPQGGQSTLAPLWSWQLIASGSSCYTYYDDSYSTGGTMSTSGGENNSNNTGFSGQSGAGTGSSTTSNTNTVYTMPQPFVDIEDDDHTDDIYFETMIDSVLTNTNLGPCSTTIVNNFLNGSIPTSKKLTKILDRLNLKTGPQTGYTFEIKTDVLTGTDFGSTYNRVDPLTNLNIPFNYLVIIDSNFNQNGTRIAKANVIVHELIHAYILSLIDDNSLQLAPYLEPSADLTNLSIIFNAIERKKYGLNPNYFQHNEMAQSFISVIAEAIKIIDGGTQPNQYYQDLAWGGLTDTGAFLTLHPVGTASYQRIKYTILSENTNTPYPTALAGTITPKSTPCP
ncbi:hypothetical protein [Flavobacterium sp.]|uniref:hypothetical protein n=1 Tax=Flavobacterium sp. TaxID=239 RepID=UPI0026216BDC|nr:hypothetical protein [Flavobacterium sp.]